MGRGNVSSTVSNGTLVVVVVAGGQSNKIGGLPVMGDHCVSFIGKHNGAN